MEARVQHGEMTNALAFARRLVERLQRHRIIEIDERETIFHKQVGEMFGFLDGGRADQRRLPARGGGLDLADDAFVFLVRRPVDLVVLVKPRDGPVGGHLDHVEVVDLHELVGLGRGGAGHARELGIETEVVLERDRRQRLILGLDLNMFLRFERLVQAFRIAPALHHAAGEFVDDHDLVIADDVILVALEERVGAQRLVHVVDQGGVLGVIEIALGQQAGVAQQLLDLAGALLGEGDRTLLLVEIVIGPVEARDYHVDGVVEIRAVVEGAGNDERRARLVHEDRIDFVDDRVVVAPLDHLGHLVLHVIAQIIEAVFVVGAVGDVGSIGLGPLQIVEPVHDDAHSEPEEAVDLAHPFAIAAGQIIVHRDHVHALAGERIQIDRERRNQRLAFARSHLGDRALVKHHAADQLDVERTLAERPLGGLADGGEGRHQKVIERRTGRKFGPELLGTGAQLVVRELLELGLQRVDRVHLGPKRLKPAVIDRAKDFLRERTEHRKPSDYQDLRKGGLGRVIDLIIGERILKTAPRWRTPGPASDAGKPPHERSCDINMPSLANVNRLGHRSTRFGRP